MTSLPTPNHCPSVHSEPVPPQKYRGKRAVLGGFTAILVLLSIAAVEAQGTAFTYQGRLTDDGGPAQGAYDLRLILYDAPVGGAQVGPILALEDVAVVNGLFTVSLDFGAGVFAGSGRWLEIAVRPGVSVGNHTSLSPRQELTPSPGALFSQTAPWSGLSGVPGSFPPSPHNHSAGDVTSGTLGDARLSLNVALLGSVQTFSAAKTFSASPAFTAAGAPFTVSSATRVANLNADLLDGRDSTQFASSSPPLTLTGDEALHIIKGTNSSTSVLAAAVVGDSTGLSGTVFGVRGTADSPDGVGVYGLHDAATGTAPGIWAETDSTATGAAGVYGFADAGTGTTYGVFGQSDSSAGRGVYGFVPSATGSGDGVMGETASSTGASAGVRGLATATSGAAHGVVGETSGPSGAGVFGANAAATDRSFGVYGYSNSTAGRSGYFNGSRAQYAGYFFGDATVTGTLSKGGGAFKIDHPLDPENRYLYHSFVESPDMMNVYNGLAVTDSEGYASVELPAWFEALNRDFRYQLTVVDEADSEGFVLVKVVQGVGDSRFRLRTSAGGVTVSWQVTGIRKDAWAEKHRIPVEEDKPAAERGRYLHPVEHGQAEEKGFDYEENRHLSKFLRPEKEGQVAPDKRPPR